MRPTLFTIGPFPIRSYGVMVAIAFLVAIYIAALRAKKEGIPSYIISNLGLIVLVSGLLGARIFHIIQHIKSYDTLLDALKIWEGGLAYYGGFIAAVAVGVLYLRSKKVSIARVVDIIAPSLALGIGIARIGCFLAGCCFGKPTSLPWGVTFPQGSLASLLVGMQKVHPTQLYSALSLFIIFVILITLRKYMKFPGELFLLFVVIYAIYRFFIDFLRYYSTEEHIGFLATSQVTSLIAGVIALAILIFIAVRRVSTPNS